MDPAWQLIRERLERLQWGISTRQEEMKTAISVGQEKTRIVHGEMIQTLSIYK
jgi:hypothetical protein